MRVFSRGRMGGKVPNVVMNELLELIKIMHD
jgi:hypothetical protein